MSQGEKRGSACQFDCNIFCRLLLFTDGYHGHEAPSAADAAAIGCRPAADLLRSKLDLHIADDDDVMSCSDDLQTDSSQNINDSDEHRTSGQYNYFIHRNGFGSSCGGGGSPVRNMGPCCPKRFFGVNGSRG